MGTLKKDASRAHSPRVFNFCDTSRLKRKFRPKRARQDQHTYQLRGPKRCKTSVLAAWRRCEATLGQHTSKNVVRTPYAYACLGKNHARRAEYWILGVMDFRIFGRFRAQNWDPQEAQNRARRFAPRPILGFRGVSILRAKSAENPKIHHP